MQAVASQTEVRREAEPLSQSAMDYARVERALRFLNANYLQRPTLDEIAAHVHLSPFHFERLFQRWAGTSPKRFLQYLTKEHAKSLLRDSSNMLEATYESGLSGTGRLHDLFVSCEAVTPGEYKRRGKGVIIRYGFHSTPFGECLLAKTDRGICALRFLSSPSKPAALRELRGEWAAAEFVKDDSKTGEICGQIFSGAAEDVSKPFHLHLRGTNFQLKVWQALLTIPAYLIPCHRVIRSLGVIGDYRWGRERKQAMIGWETGRTAS
jgi:AraC family transcriptional regulator, regulatory protein of adaptative response / methylated-DNA-[protein]-cysteine methyltransferase